MKHLLVFLLLAMALPSVCVAGVVLEEAPPLPSVPPASPGPHSETVVEQDGPRLPALSQLPAEVRTQMMPGGQSVYFRRFPIGPNDSPALVHLWRQQRGTLNTTNGGGMVYFLDVFMRPMVTAPPQPGSWELTGSAVHLDLNHDFGSYPPSISVHWLHPNTKEGLVMTLLSNGSSDANAQIVTFPGATYEAYKQVSYSSTPTRGYVQEFLYGGSGPERLGLGYDVDADGTLRVLSLYSPKGGTPQTRPYRWNGYAWFRSSDGK